MKFTSPEIDKMLDYYVKLFKVLLSVTLYSIFSEIRFEILFWRNIDFFSLENRWSITVFAVHHEANK